MYKHNINSKHIIKQYIITLLYKKTCTPKSSLKYFFKVTFKDLNYSQISKIMLYLLEGILFFKYIIKLPKRYIFPFKCLPSM